MESILIAEDDEISRQLLQINLQKWGYDVIAVKNGKEAFEVLKQKDHPQIAILDWMMPEMDGLEVCEKFRGIDSGRYCYIILLTAKSLVEDVVKGLEAGADDYVIKPFNKTVLKARLTVGLRVVELEREREKQLKLITKSNKKVIEDLEAASQVQHSLLPNNIPASKNFQFEWIYKPSSLLGGDMINVIKLSEDKFIFYVLDVSGHGAQAALLSVSIQFHLNKDLVSLFEIKSESDFNEFPRKVVNQLSEHYANLLTTTGQYFTLLFGVLDLEQKKCSYVRAGHLKPILFRDGSSQILDDDAGPPIGMFGGADYPTFKLKLDSEERLYVFTDGVIEVLNEKQEDYGFQRLANELEKQAKQNLPLDYVIKDVEKWNEKKAFNDDVTLLEIKCTGN